MTAERRIDWSDLRQAEQRIDTRFRQDWERTSYRAAEAVDAVTLADQWRDGHRPEAREEDLADALLLLDEARQDLISHADYNELQVLDALRGRGWTWQRIGEHLQYPADVAERRARARYDRVRKLFPGYKPKREAPASVGGAR
jgi:hypothetical protein